MTIYEMLADFEAMQHECDQEGYPRGVPFIRTIYGESGETHCIEIGLRFEEIEGSGFGTEEQFLKVYPDNSVMRVGG